MQVTPVSKKRTAFALSFFCCLSLAPLLAACASSVAPRFPSQIMLVSNYSMAKGDTYEEAIYKKEGDAERRVLWSRSGPAHGACTQGCASLYGQINANAGDYRIELSNAARKGRTSVAFTVHANEYWVLMVSDNEVPPSFPARNEKLIFLQNDGPYRLDVVAVGSAGLETPEMQPRPRERKLIPAHFPKGHPEARK